MSCCKNCVDAPKPSAQSLDLEHLNALVATVDSYDVIRTAISNSTPIAKRLHVTKSGNVFLKAGTVVDGDGYVVAVGNIGALPYRGAQKIAFKHTTLSVTFSLEAPARFEYTIQYEATGVVKNDDGKVVKISGFRPSENIPPTEISLELIICIVACGGEAVLDAALDCAGELPDPPAFVACIAAEVALDPETEACIEGCLT